MANLQAELSVKVMVNGPSTVAGEAAIKVGATGAGMLKVLDETGSRLPELKLKVTPERAVLCPAVRPVKVATPLAAATDSPPLSAQEPPPP